MTYKLEANFNAMLEEMLAVGELSGGTSGSAAMASTISTRLFNAPSELSLRKETETPAPT